MAEQSPTTRLRPEPTRLAEVLGAFSLAADLTLGLPAEHGVRSCYIGMRLAEEIEVSPEERADLYYAQLVKDSGCTCSSSQIASLIAGDEMAAVAELLSRDPSDELAMFGWIVRHVAAGAPFATRAKQVLDFLIHSREFERDGAAGECEVAQRMAYRLGLSEGVQVTLASCLERWDGKCMPRGLRQGAIPLISRIMHVAGVTEVFHRIGGPGAAKDVALARKGKAFDPQIVEAFLSVATSTSFWEGLEQESLWETVLALEPESRERYLSEAQLENVARAR